MPISAEPARVEPPSLAASTLPSRVPSLDGLRAVSILMVLLGHLSGTHGFINVPSRSTFGVLGVRIFFVISGFIITHLLLKELQREGRINIVRFYFRRTLRIFPPYFVFLGAMAVATALGWVAVAPHDFLYAATYTMNYLYHRPWSIAHLWSLSCEEQFYLLMPTLFAWLGLRHAGWAAAAVLALCPLVRVIEWRLGWRADVRTHLLEWPPSAV